MTLSQTKLFEVKEWKCHYFWDSVIFWCWKSSLKKLNFRALAIDGFWTKKHETKFFWLFLMRSNPCFIRFEIKNHWLPLLTMFKWLLCVGNILMVKIKPKKAELLGSGDQWVLDQITWDQIFWVIFDEI